MFRDDGSQVMSFEPVADVSESFQNDALKCTQLRIDTSDGVFTSDRVQIAEVKFGSSVTLTLEFEAATFVPVSAQSVVPKYYALPLINYIGHYGDSSLRVASNPLWLHPASWPCTEFELCGNPAFIQKLEYKVHDSRCEAIESGRSKYEAPAMLVGEYCAALQNDPAFDIFRFGVLPVLSLATGTQVLAPWIEFRDEHGGLARREHVLWRGPGYCKGHRAIEDVRGRRIAKLLQCAQESIGPGRHDWQQFGKKEWARILHRVIQIGWNDMNSWEQMCQHACIAIDSLSNRFGVAQRRLRDEIPSADAGALDKIFVDACKLIKEVKNRQRSAHEGAIVERMSERVRQAGGVVREFNCALKALLEEFGLNDFNMMVNYGPYMGRNSWSRAVLWCRNAVMHDVYFAEPGEDLEEFVCLVRHLHDIALRLVLCLVGYRGEYVPAGYPLGVRSVDWVTPATSPLEMGYP